MENSYEHSELVWVNMLEPAVTLNVVFMYLWSPIEVPTKIGDTKLLLIVKDITGF